MATRRDFLASLIAASAVPRIGWSAVGNPAYLAAARLPDDSFALFGLAEDGNKCFGVPLPARGHAGAGHPLRPHVVAFARRPGSYALVIDCRSGAVLHYISPPEGRQLNGHGVYSSDGELLFTSEQDAATSAGVIGVWDVGQGYRRAAEISSFGIGPHDLRLTPDGQSLVVANGGIATDPTDRTKLNIDSMRPNLSYLAMDGSLLEKVELDAEIAQNSIRHLTIRADGLLAFAMQWEGEPAMAPPLVGLHRRGASPVLAQAPLADELAMQGYAGSIAFSGDGSELAISSPKGGRLNRFSADGQFLGHLARTDICGLAGHSAGLLASDGHGGLIALAGGQPQLLGHHDLAWDNHIVAL